MHSLYIMYTERGTEPWTTHVHAVCPCDRKLDLFLKQLEKKIKTRVLYTHPILYISKERGVWGKICTAFVIIFIFFVLFWSKFCVLLRFNERKKLLKRIGIFLPFICLCGVAFIHFIRASQTYNLEDICNMYLDNH